MNQNSKSKSQIRLKKRGTKVTLDWRDGRNNTAAWNEICAWAIEKFGLPGDRFTWHPTEDHMEFNFEHEEDAVYFILRWS